MAQQSSAGTTLRWWLLAFSLLVAGRGFQYLGVDMAKNLKSVIKKIAGFSGKTLNKRQAQIPSETVIAAGQGLVLE